MSKPAAKQGDKVIAIDTHIVMVPSPAGPVPTPTPMPFDGTLTGALGQKVSIQNQPAAMEGSTATGTPHVPAGGPFQKPPSNSATIQTGSTRVFIENRAAARTGDPAMTCNDPADAPKGKVVGAGRVLIGDRLEVHQRIGFARQREGLWTMKRHLIFSGTMLVLALSACTESDTGGTSGTGGSGGTGGSSVAATTCKRLCDKAASVEAEQGCTPVGDAACREGCESYYETVPECNDDYDVYEQCVIEFVSAANCACDPMDDLLSCGVVTGCDAELAATKACICKVHPENTDC